LPTLRLTRRSVGWAKPQDANASGDVPTIFSWCETAMVGTSSPAPRAADAFAHPTR
jgi:hypothetical protein